MKLYRTDKRREMFTAKEKILFIELIEAQQNKTIYNAFLQESRG